MLQYEANLEKAPLEPPEAFERYAKAMIIKYSLLRDPPVDPKTGKPVAARKRSQRLQASRPPDRVEPSEDPSNPDYAELRQWLHFRYVAF